MFRTLILYYSIFGRSRKFARILQKNTGFELERIRDRGFILFPLLMAGLRIGNKIGSPILPIQHDIAGSQRLVLVVPVFSKEPSPAIRRFFSEYDLAGKEICCVLTYVKKIGRAPTILRDLIESVGAVCTSCALIQMTPQLVSDMEANRLHWTLTADGKIVKLEHDSPYNEEQE